MWVSTDYISMTWPSTAPPWNGSEKCWIKVAPLPGSIFIRPINSILKTDLSIVLVFTWSTCPISTACGWESISITAHRRTIGWQKFPGFLSEWWEKCYKIAEMPGVAWSMAWLPACIGAVAKRLNIFGKYGMNSEYKAVEWWDIGYLTIPLKPETIKFWLPAT